MRILYIDIDSLRPDHLGCYGYHRDTSPNIDRLAAEGVRFTNCYTPDAPCLPSRTALFSGQAGIHTGVVNHGGGYADPFGDGPTRGFGDSLKEGSWPGRFRELGYKTVAITPFGERHSAWHIYAGFNEVYNTGGNGNELAEEVSPVAIDWLERHKGEDSWFMHLNIWDPHTPYRTPESFGEPFANDDPPAWLTEEIRAEHWSRPGPHSAQEVLDYTSPPHWPPADAYPRQPRQADNLAAVKKIFDGYDTGVRYADEHVGRIIAKLEEQGILNDTMVIISSDHGENLGELNIYGDHQTADYITSRVPLIVRYPGFAETAQKAPVRHGLIYNYDWAATAVELAGGTVPDRWDGHSFADAFMAGEDFGHENVVVSQNAWTCQRAVRWQDFIYIRTYAETFHGYPEEMVFDLGVDPHETNDLAPSRPDLVEAGRARLGKWVDDMMLTSRQAIDPLWGVLREGGPYHGRTNEAAYLQRLRDTGRAAWADYFEKRLAMGRR